MQTTDNQQIKLVADSALIYNKKILLVTYIDSNKYDHQKGWFIPDDLIKYDEHPEDAAIRILNEQVGYESGNLTLSHIESFIGGNKSWHLIFHYYLVVDALPDILPNDNIDRFEWYDFNNLPDANQIAHHGWAKYILDEIISKINNN